MKLFSIKLILALAIIPGISFSQLAENSWNFGFGGSYPRYMAITTPSHTGVKNYGAFLFLQRNFSEHVGLRLEPNFNHIESEYPGNNGGDQFQKLDLFAANLDLIYYLVPCAPVSPFLNAGFGGIIYTSKNSPEQNYDGAFAAYQFNIGAGAEWRIGSSWKVLTQFSYHLASTNDIDGRDDPINKGLFGTTSDSYAKLDVGFVYYFSKGKPSKTCTPYEGIRRDTIVKIIEKHIPEKAPMVAVPAPEPPEENWVLIGVNFDFGSAKLTEESYPVLLYAIQILQNNPEMKVEIQGHTDSIGSNAFNMKLSKERAQTVESFLIKNGIDPKRLTTQGFGETQPVSKISAAKGRAANRRIEFKILEQ